MKLVVLDQSLDTSTPSGKLLLHVLASISEFENDLRKDRQMQGIDLAKRKGIKFGRKHSLTEEQVQEVKAKRDQGIKILDLMSEYKISKASIYRALAQWLHAPASIQKKFQPSQLLKEQFEWLGKKPILQYF